MTWKMKWTRRKNKDGLMIWMDMAQDLTNIEDKMMWQPTKQPFQKNEKIIMTSRPTKRKRN